MAWQPKRINPRHKLAAMLIAMGKENEEVAKFVGWKSSQSVQNFKGSEAGKILLAEAEKEIKERLLDKTVDLYTKFDKMAPKAAGTLDALMEDADSDSVRLGAAKDVLDRAPSAPKTRKIAEETSKVHIHLSMKVAECMQEALEDVGETEIVELLEEEPKAIEDKTEIKAKSVEEIKEDL